MKTKKYFYILILEKASIFSREKRTLNGEIIDKSGASKCKIFREIIKRDEKDLIKTKRKGSWNIFYYHLEEIK